MSFHPSDYQANDGYFLQNFVTADIVMGGDTMQDVYTHFTEKKIDVCIAMRLHSIILSQVYEIPFIALNYSQKTDQILKKLSV
jgi:exopolysaccharide biosynthesis predicted pyruvyltransferase EpsI